MITEWNSEYVSAADLLATEEELQQPRPKEEFTGPVFFQEPGVEGSAIYDPYYDTHDDLGPKRRSGCARIPANPQHCRG